MNIFSENVEQCACRICFTIDKVKDTIQCSYNDESMFDIVNVVLKLPPASSNYLEKLCMNCLESIINVHLFVRKLNGRKTFWGKALSRARAIALPTDNDDASIFYNQKLLRIDEVSIKNEPQIECGNTDSEHVEYELIIKDEPRDIIDKKEQYVDEPDDSHVHTDNADYSDFTDEDDLPLISLAGQEDFSITKGDSEPVTTTTECDARKLASTSTQAKNTKKYVLCHECGKMYGNNRIKNHMMLHKNHTEFQCDICDYVGTEMHRHRRRYHGKLTKPLSCQECNSVHNNLHDFKEHLKIHDQKYRAQELNVLATNACHKCGKTYFFADTLARHLRSHDEGSDTWCKHCQKGFPTTFHYKRHMRTHTGEKPYACPYCPKRYKQNSNFKKHVQWHDNKKRENRCELFGARTYNTKQSLDDHLAMHTDENSCKATSEKCLPNVSFDDATSKAVVSCDDIADALNEELSATNSHNIP